mgnify:CR=1 FL=1
MKTTLLFRAALLGVALNSAVGATTIEFSNDRFILDLRYNTNSNFLGTNVYAEFGLSKCHLHPELAVALHTLAPKLKEMKLKIILFDCFRPIEVQRAMWRMIQDPRYVADPKKGSNHNRGLAIDVGLAFENGRPLIFPTEFDDFTPKARHAYQCPASAKEPCTNRAILKNLMTSAGLRSIESEWWHYEYPNAKQYPLIESLYVKTQ